MEQDATHDVVDVVEASTSIETEQRQADENEMKRVRSQTEKGRSFARERLAGKRNVAYKKLLHKIQSIEALVDPGKASPSSYALVQAAYKDYMNLYERFCDSHDEYCETLSEDELTVYLDEWYSNKDDKISAFKVNVQQWLRMNAECDPDSDSRSVRSCRSNRSYRSCHSSERSNGSRSSLQSAKLREQQQKAELVAKGKALEKRKALELEKLRLRMQEEQLELDTALAVSDARADVIENELRQTDQAIIEPTQPSVQLNPPSMQLTPEVESYVPLIRINNVKENQSSCKPASTTNSTTTNEDNLSSVIKHLKCRTNL